MTRHHATSEGNVPFTADEEAEQDAVDLEYSSGALQRAKDDKIASIDKQTGLDIISIAGNKEKQQNRSSAFFVALHRKEDVASYVALFIAIDELIDDGNAREVRCEKAKTLTELEAI